MIIRAWLNCAFFIFNVFDVVLDNINFCSTVHLLILLTILNVDVYMGIMLKLIANLAEFQLSVYMGFMLKLIANLVEFQLSVL